MAAWNPKANEIFVNALEKSTPESKAAYLDERCGSDADLRQQVDALLAAHGQAGSFLNGPAAGPAATGPAATGPAAEVLTAAYAADPQALGTILAGKYKLVEPIGGGGMGTVYMAQQTQPVKRLVAVKVIKAGMDSKAVLARFDAERQALAMMDHANIARVFDAGATSEGQPFFVMELVKGVPITKFCDERKLPPRDRLELFIQVCQAIQHAHQKGIIHRDIKPSNVLVAMYDDRAVPKVIDFGVAKAAGLQLTDHTLVTNFGAVVGTPEYMSPEQASFNQMDVDTRSDVYALGVLLYELLTGATPVDRKSLGQAAVMEILRIVREVEPLRPSDRLSTSDALPSIAANRQTEPAKLTLLLRGELDWVVMKALEKDRARRYDTANALARDVQRYLADEIVEARPPSAGYRLRKFVRRYKGRVIAASLLFLALVGGILGTSWGLIEATTATKLAQDEQKKTQAAQIEATASAEREKKAAADSRAKEEFTRRLLYVSQINHAQTALNDNRIPRVLQLLNDTTPKPGEPDLRGWEWHYLNRQIRPPVASEFHLPLDADDPKRNGFSFSTDGRWITTWGETDDGIIFSVWDAQTGRRAWRTPNPILLSGPQQNSQHWSAVDITAVPSPDGRTLVISRECSPQVGKPLQKLFRILRVDTGEILPGPGPQDLPLFFYLGMGTADGKPGAMVNSVALGGPAHIAGLKVGDIILTINKKVVNDSDEFLEDLRVRKPGDKITLSTLRGDQKAEVTIILGARVARPPGLGGRSLGEMVVGLDAAWLVWIFDTDPSLKPTKATIWRWDRSTGKVTNKSVLPGSGGKIHLLPDGQTAITTPFWQRLLPTGFNESNEPAPVECWDLSADPPRLRWQPILVKPSSIFAGNDGFTISASGTAAAICDYREKEFRFYRLSDGEMLWRTSTGVDELLSQPGNLDYTLYLSDDGNRLLITNVSPHKLTILEKPRTQGVNPSATGTPNRMGERNPPPQRRLDFRAINSNFYYGNSGGLNADGRRFLYFDYDNGRMVRALDLSGDQDFAPSIPGEGPFVVQNVRPWIIRDGNGKDIGRFEPPDTANSPMRIGQSFLVSGARRLLLRSTRPWAENEKKDYIIGPEQWSLFKLEGNDKDRKVATGDGFPVTMPDAPWFVVRVGSVVEVHDAFTGQPLRTISPPTGLSISRLDMVASDLVGMVTNLDPQNVPSPAQQFVNANRDPLPLTLRLFDTRTGKELWAKQFATAPPRTMLLNSRGPGGAVVKIVLSPDKRRIFAFYQEQGDRFNGPSNPITPVQILVLRANDFMEERTIKFSAQSASLVGFAPDGQLVVGAWEELQLWNPDTGQMTLRLPGHEGSVTKALFSEDGTRLFAFASKRIHVWDFVTRRELLSLGGGDLSTFPLVAREAKLVAGRLYFRSFDGKTHVLDGTPAK